MLGLSYNRLTALPIDFQLLYRLQELLLAANNITEISKDFAKLKNLVKIDLSDNYLTMLPETLIKLTNLKQLDLTDNMILQWPSNFAKLQDRVDVSYSRGRVIFAAALFRLWQSPNTLLKRFSIGSKIHDS